MDFNRFKQAYDPLGKLLDQYAVWQKLGNQIKSSLPENLSPYYRVACIEQDVLVIYADNNMVANRLRMLIPAVVEQWKSTLGGFDDVRVKVKSKNIPPQRENQLKLPQEAIDSMRASSERLAHHPELAQALLNLIDEQTQK